MSVYGAMYSGVSGLKAQSNALGIISDNISNVNTVGYKGSKASFETLVTQAATQTTYTPGGVGSKPLQGVDKQGLLQGTSNATDLAISGNGMFVVNESADPDVGDDFMFTRAGEFRPDEAGNLRNAAGFFLQGWELDDDGNLPPAQQTIESVETVNVSNLSGLPQQTTTLSAGANLPSDAAQTPPAVAVSNGDTPPFTDATPANSVYQSSAQIFDSLGNPHTINFYFQKTNATPGEWEILAHSETAGFVDAGGNPQPVNDMASIDTITFDGDGSPMTDLTYTLQIHDFAGTNNALTGANPGGHEIELDFGSAGEFDGLTNFSSDFTGFTELNQNGLKFGNFTGINVNDEGVVTAVFDNGRRKDIYQLPIAMFSNVNGLEERSGNAYLQTGESGNLLLAEAGVGGAGDVAPSALEQSTVDLAEEFTRMITTQRAYSASTKVITTSDEMLQELTQAIR
jgi:flagellar hook protein FlgE